MIDERRKAILAAQRKDLADEENHYLALKLVFGSREGLDVANWILSDLCGYWAPSITDIGEYNVGRAFFNALALADQAICHELLARRRDLAEKVRAAERQRIDEELKQI